MTVGELIDNLGGNLIQGSPNLEIESVSSYEQAGPDCLVFADSTTTVPEALASEAGAVVLAPGAASSTRNRSPSSKPNSPAYGSPAPPNSSTLA